MYAEVLNNIAAVTAVSFVIATALVLSSKYIIKMLAIDFHLI